MDEPFAKKMLEHLPKKLPQNEAYKRNQRRIIR